MSFILEALKRSEQERLQGGLPVREPPRTAPGQGRRLRWRFLYLAVGAGMLTAVVLVAGYFWSWPDAPDAEVAASVESAASGVRSRSPVIDPAPDGKPQLSAQTLSGEMPGRLPDSPAPAAKHLASPASGDAAVGVTLGEAVRDEAPDVEPPARADVLPNDAAPETDSSIVVRSDRARGSAADTPGEGKPLPPEPVPAEVTDADNAPSAPVDDAAARKPKAVPPPVSGGEVLDLRASAVAKAGPVAREARPVASLPPRASAAIRKEVGALDLQVHVYDRQAVRRFVMIDGRMLHEGESVKPGLTVEEIVAQGVVMSWKGNRFLLARGG